MSQAVTPDEAGLRAAAAAIVEGQLVGMPTETVYGLAACATNADAILRVFAAKRRPHFDPLIVHVLATSLGELEGLVDFERLDARGRAAAERLSALWPGPLTLVLPKTARVPDEATSGLDTLALRSPSHPVARALIEAAGPLVAPSANRFGRISPTRPAHVLEELADEVAMVLDGGPCEHGVESTIVGVERDGTARLLRPGATPREAVEAALGARLEAPRSDAGAPAAPGMLASHYAPRKPLVVFGEGHARPGPAAWLGWSDDAPPSELNEVVARRALAPDGRAETGARRLFALLRELDAGEAAWICAAPCPVRDGLGPAIADRLRRASAGRPDEDP